MAGFSKYLAQAVFNMCLNPALASWTPPAAIYLGLHTSPPDDSTYGAEASFGNYRRVQIGSMTSSVLQGSPSTEWLVRAQNASAVVFPTSDGPDQTITHWAIWDHPNTGQGNILFSGAVGAPKTVAAGDALTIGNGQLMIDFK